MPGAERRPGRADGPGRLRWRRPPRPASWSCTSASSPSLPRLRRAGLASRLLARAETEALARGAKAAFAFGWLPAGRPEPDAVPFYEAAGYEARPDIPGFYAEGSVATGALCPYCGEPPCRCAARPFVKELGPG